MREAIKARLRRFILSTVADEMNRVGERLIHNFYSADQLFHDAASFVVYNQIPGDYLEFGVYRGDSLCDVYHRLLHEWTTFQEHAKLFGHKCPEDYWQSKKFFAFDSFEGLPNTASEETPIHFQAGVYKMPLQSFLSNIKTKNVDPAKVIAVPGWFEEVLTPELKVKYHLSQACLIFVDCDLYESAVAIFTFITDLVQDGTVIVIDDYFRYRGSPRMGIRRAFNEWLQKNPEFKTTELTRCSANRIAFICHK